MTDSFDQAYERGITERLPAAEIAPRVTRLAVAAEGLALRGCLLAPEGPIKDGYLVVEPGATIAAVQRRRPELMTVIETAGIVLPGLIDLHGHPEFNVLAAWEPPERFANRYAWRASDVYRRVVREPQNRLRDALPAGTQTRYAEVRALVGGTTAIQGASAEYPDAAEALVRNVDLTVFGEHRARAMVDLPSEEKPDNLPRLHAILDDIRTHEVRAFYLHLSEGRHDDAVSVREFERAVELGALTPATVAIHGTALNRDHFGAMREIGSKLVWSPQSQLRLYGEATRVADALAVGLPVGLGADWLPSGSRSLLAELKVGRRRARVGTSPPRPLGERGRGRARVGRAGADRRRCGLRAARLGQRPRRPRSDATSRSRAGVGKAHAPGRVVRGRHPGPAAADLVAQYPQVGPIFA